MSIGRVTAVAAMALLVGALPGSVNPVGAAEGSATSEGIDFEAPDYTLGSIDAQQGWGAQNVFDAAIDQEVVSNVAAPASFGARSWRISNGYTTQGYDSQPSSPSTADEAGETSADDGGLSGGTRQRRFVGQWDVASAVPGAEQAGLTIDVSPNRGDTSRMSLARISDTPTGLNVEIFDYHSDVECDGFSSTDVATDLDRTQPHRIKMLMDFIDGPDNDVVRTYVDGTLVHTGPSWEAFYADDCELAPAASRTVDSLMFRIRGTAVPANDGHGFLIDNVVTRSSARGTCRGQDVTVDLAIGQVPTDGPDVIRGTAGGDFINALEGNDIVCSLGGNDTVDLGGGADWADGGLAADRLSGSTGSDTLLGANGVDDLRGGLGNDLVSGGMNNDVLFGGAGNDRHLGGDGSDRCAGGSGADTARQCETQTQIP